MEVSESNQVSFIKLTYGSVLPNDFQQYQDLYRGLWTIWLTHLFEKWLESVERYLEIRTVLVVLFAKDLRDFFEIHELLDLSEVIVCGIRVFSVLRHGDLQEGVRSGSEL